MLFLLFWKCSKTDRCLLKTKVGWDGQLSHGWANSSLLRRVGKRKPAPLQREGTEQRGNSWDWRTGLLLWMLPDNGSLWEVSTFIGRPGLLLHPLSRFFLLEHLMPWHLWSSCCQSNSPGLWQNWNKQLQPWPLCYPWQPMVGSCLLCLY